MTHQSFFFFILFLFSSLAMAADKVKMKGLVYEAENSTIDNEKETVELDGNVQIILKDQHIKCQKAVINFRSKSIDAAGEVSMTSMTNTVGGKRVVLDLETSTGIIYDGFVQSASVLFEGTVLLKTSDTEFIADNAKYTTCTNCPESWSFTGTKIKAELGGYAYIRNSTLRFGGFPIFWMPYLIVPLKSDRQSGLLTPDFERSLVGGLTIAESYFWAMSRSQDSTWTLKNYELRGLKGLLNYRYMNSENSYGEFDTAILQDRVFSNSDRVNTFRGANRSILNRWFIKYDHYYEMPDNMAHRMNINNASDLQYPKDFPLETRNSGDSSMENRISMSKTAGNVHWFVDTSYFVNLLQSNPLASNQDSVHRLPEISVNSTLAPIGESGFLYNWNLTYTNFARGHFAFDTLTSNGNYRFIKAKDKNTGTFLPCKIQNWETQENCVAYHDSAFDPSKDLIRTGQRLDGQFSVERPFSMGRLEFLPRLSLRETDYRFTVGNSISTFRRYARADFASRTIFSRIFDIENSKDRIKHEIQPELAATAIPWIDQPAHPFFGALANSSPYTTQNNVSDSDLNSPYGLQFDYLDRTYERKLITFALTNRFIRKSVGPQKSEYKQFFSWRLAQSYDFYQAEGNSPREAYSDISSDLALLLDRIHFYQRMNYFPYQVVTNSSSRVRLLNEDGDFVQLGYNISYNITPGQIVDATTRTEQYSLTFKKSVRYLDLLSKIIYDLNPSKPDQPVNSYGIGAQLRLPGECWYIRVIQYRPTGGEDNVKFTFDFSFDGQKKEALPESLIETFSF